MKVYCILLNKEVILAEGNRCRDQFTCFIPTTLNDLQSWLENHAEELR